MKRVVGVFVAAVLAAVVLVAGVLVPGGKAASTATTKITVKATEFKYVLSRKTAPKGTVIFTLVNKGKLPHDFKIAGKKTAVIKPGKTAILKITVSKKLKLAYLCTVPGHAPAGMKGTFAAG